MKSMIHVLATSLSPASGALSPRTDRSTAEDIQRQMGASSNNRR